mmetsp:Transcript_25290/g.84464  ORF Transcript_25290/g.84464 Transcript_25290/m.84464 type:complete len:776 (+) Transcript_25290:431-2758(+)
MATSPPRFTAGTAAAADGAADEEVAEPLARSVIMTSSSSSLAAPSAASLSTFPPSGLPPPPPATPSPAPSAAPSFDHCRCADTAGAHLPLAPGTTVDAAAIAAMAPPARCLFSASLMFSRSRVRASQAACSIPIRASSVLCHRFPLGARKLKITPFCGLSLPLTTQPDAGPLITSLAMATCCGGGTGDTCGVAAFEAAATAASSMASAESPPRPLRPLQPPRPPRPPRLPRPRRPRPANPGCGATAEAAAGSAKEAEREAAPAARKRRAISPRSLAKESMILESKSRSLTPMKLNHCSSPGGRYLKIQTPLFWNPWIVQPAASPSTSTRSSRDGRACCALARSEAAPRAVSPPAAAVFAALGEAHAFGICFPCAFCCGGCIVATVAAAAAPPLAFFDLFPGGGASAVFFVGVSCEPRGRFWHPAAPASLAFAWPNTKTNFALAFALPFGFGSASGGGLTSNLSKPFCSNTSLARLCTISWSRLQASVKAGDSSSPRPFAGRGIVGSSMDPAPTSFKSEASCRKCSMRSRYSVLCSALSCVHMTLECVDCPQSPQRFARCFAFPSSSLAPTAPSVPTMRTSSSSSSFSPATPMALPLPSPNVGAPPALAGAEDEADGVTFSGANGQRSVRCPGKPQFPHTSNAERWSKNHRLLFDFGALAPFASFAFASRCSQHANHRVRKRGGQSCSAACCISSFARCNLCASSDRSCSNNIILIRRRTSSSSRCFLFAAKLLFSSRAALFLSSCCASKSSFRICCRFCCSSKARHALHVKNTAF